jgi:membrane protease YdiL (CAAX protease family)
MIHTVNKPVPQWPQALTFAPYRELKKHQVQKVTLVAIACLMLFGLQLSYSWTFSIGVALACSVVTLVSETFIRKENPNNPNWMNANFDATRILYEMAHNLVLVPLGVGLLTAFGMTPLQGIAVQIMNGNLRIIFLATIIAPIAEEILFRGFLLERLEDLMTLTSQTICSIPAIIKEFVPLCLQAVVFGAIHITGKQVIEKGKRFFIFSVLSAFGFYISMYKRNDRSLLSPVAAHSTHNGGIVLGLLGGSLLKRHLNPSC